MAKEGERGKRNEERGEAGGEEEEGKRTARWLPRVPTRPPRRETYAVSCSLRLHELPLLSGQTCGENKRAQAWHGYRMVSNFVLLYALYGDTPYITAANRSVLARNRTRPQPGFDDIVYFQDTCSWLNSIERVDLRTAGSLRDRQYLRINRLSC